MSGAGGKSGGLGDFLNRAGAGPTAVALAMNGAPAQLIDVEMVKPIPGLNPRGAMTGESAFEGESFEALKASIQHNEGLLQPLIVRPHPEHSGQYQLIAGERRWRAVRDLGFPKVLAMVRALSDQQIQVVVREENDLREGLADIDRKVSLLRAIARNVGLEPEQLLPVFVRLRKKPGEVWAPGSTEALTLESMKRLRAPSLATLVAQWSRYLYFTQAECEALACKQVSASVLVALSKLPPDTDPETRRRLLSEAIAGQWTGKQMGQAVKALEARAVKPERARVAALAETREQIKSMLSKDALKTLEIGTQEKLLQQIQALIKETTGT